jgi:outer membrane protein OmpA-like peptidoglycan-associated protein
LTASAKKGFRMLLNRNGTLTFGNVAIIVSNLLVLFSNPTSGFAQSNDTGPGEQKAATLSVGVGGNAEASTAATPKAQGSADVKEDAKAQRSAKAEKPGGQKAEKADEDKKLDKYAWQRRYRKYNSWYGPTGGILLIDPTSGAAGSARIQLVIDDFSDSDFLYKGDRVDQVGQTLSFGWTATELMELYGSLRYVGTVSERPNTDNTKTIKEDKHIMGDLRLGVKVGAELMPLLSLGGDLGVFMPNQTGGTGPLLNSLSVQIRASLAIDLRNLESKVPLIFRLNLGYLFDNSAALIQGVENTRYKNLKKPLPRKYERRQFTTRFERFGLNINRVDQLTLGLGVEAPLEVATAWYLHPMVEWQYGIPFNRQDFVCPDWYKADPTRPFTDDRCQYNRGAKVYPMVLAAGVRAISPIRGLSVLLGVDIGLSGTSKFVRELVPVAPYHFLLGVGYDYDARPPEVRVIERKAKPSQDSVKGRINGVVIEQGSNTPLSGAAVSFIGRDLSPIQTNAEGKFVSYPMVPGRIEMEVSHPDFLRGGCSAVVPEKGGDVDVTCYIVPLPTTGQVNGAVVDQWGAAVANARIDLNGPENTSITSDPNGQFQKPLAPGEYRVNIDAPNYLIRSASLSVAPRQTATARFVLVQKPVKSALELKNNEIRFKEPIKFAPNSTEISGESVSVVAELGDLMLRSSSIRRIKVWGSTTGAKEEASVSLIRALSIKRRLVDAGVAPDRIDAVAGDGPRVKVTVEE